MDDINKLLDSIATGSWTEGFSFSQIDSIVYIVIAIIALSVVLDLLLNYHKRRGHFTHPSTSPEKHIEEIVHMINTELDELYVHPELANSIEKRLGGSGKGKRLKGEGIHPSDVRFRKLGILSPVVWKFDLNHKGHVAEGRFGKLTLNRHNFTVRTNHHRYAMNIAAQLFFFQVLAISGKDPKKMQYSYAYIKKAGEIVLAKAGKLDDSTALNEGVIFSIIKHDKKVDETIAETLAISETELKKIETVLDKNVKTVHDALKGSWRVMRSSEDKNLTWLNREIAHLERLLELMEDKKKTVKRFITEQHIEGEDRKRFGSFLSEWESDIAYVITIKDALKSIRDNCENWKSYIKNSHQIVRMMSPDANSIANRLDAESRKEKIDINKVHAMMTSFTSAKGKMIQLMRTEEAAI